MHRINRSLFGMAAITGLVVVASLTSCEVSRFPRFTYCASRATACDYPGASNTGPAPGTVLTKVPQQKTSGPGWEWSPRLGAVYATKAGAVISNLDVTGGVVIDFPNVTFTNSKAIACGGEYDGDVVAIRYKRNSEYQGAAARITNNELRGTPAGCTHRSRSGVRDVYGQAPDLFIAGNDISGTGNGITLEYSGVVQDNWVHDLGHMPGDHHSGISTHGGAKQITISHNTVLLYGMPQPGGGGVSAALTIYSDFGHAQNVVLERNLISGGAYTIFGGNSGGEYNPATPSTNIKIRWNRFVCGNWDWGSIAQFKTSSPGNEFTNNYCDQTGKTIVY